MWLDDLSKGKFPSVNKYAEPKQSFHSKLPVIEWTYCQKVFLKRVFASSSCRVWRFGSGLQLQHGRGRGAGLHPVRRRPHGHRRSVWHGDSGTGQVRSQSESVVHACVRTSRRMLQCSVLIITPKSPLISLGFSLCKPTFLPPPLHFSYQRDRDESATLTQIFRFLLVSFLTLSTRAKWSTFSNSGLTGITSCWGEKCCYPWQQLFPF